MMKAMRRIPLFAAVAAGLLPSKVFAINWDIQPRVSAFVTYVDNVRLAAVNEQSDVVYQANPAIKLSGEGPRLNVDLDYGARFLYRDRSDTDETFTQGRGSLTWSTRQDVFSVELRTMRGQQAARLENTLPTDLEAISDNRTTTTSYLVAPQFQYAFDGSAQLLVQGKYSRVDYSGGDIDDGKAENRGYSAGLSSGTNFRRADWSFNHSRQEFNVDEPDRDDYSTQSILTLGYRLNTELRGFGSIGTEKIVSQGVEVFEDDGFWQAGLEWNPTARTRLQLSTGERAFGDSQSIQVSRQGRHSVFGVSYTESVSSQSLEQAFRFTVPTTGGGVRDITLIGTSSEIFISKRADVNLSLRGRWNTVLIRVYSEKRELLNSMTEDEFRGVELNWTSNLGRRVTVDSEIGYSERESGSPRRESDYTLLSASIRRQFTTNLEASARYSYNRQTGETEGDVDQNLISLSVTGRF